MKSKLKVGDMVSVSKAFTDEDVINFSSISLDKNPIHLDSEYAEASIFGQKIVHGMLAASLFSGLLGVELPGEGSIYLGQTLRFSAPVYIGDKLTASVEVLKIREDKPIVTLRTLCVNSQGVIVIDGEATVKVPQ
ncbi:MaoC family dehydratase [bacterium]|nr:MaoC family dehydratase [bacterium]